MWRATIRFLFSVQKFDPKKDYYKILSLKQNATSQEIKKSFKTLARKYHPDSATGKQDIFKEINEAHQILSSQQLKKQYDETRKVYNSNANTHHAQRQSQSYQKYQRQQERYQSRQKAPQYQYDEDNPEKFRQYLKKKHQQQMKKYTQQRSNYDNLGRSYQNYDRFRDEALKKKKQAYNQKDKITQDSVKQQQQLYRKFSQKKDQEYRDKLRNDIKNDLHFRYKRAYQNTERTIEGIKQMGNIIQGLFKKK